MRMERLAGVAAAELQAEYWSVSARSGYKINEFFQRLAALAFETAMQQQLKLLKSTAQEQTTQTPEKSQKFGKTHQKDGGKFFIILLCYLQTYAVISQVAPANKRVAVPAD